MYINAVEIAKRKRNRRKGELDPNTNKIINGDWYFECPYAAPPILDKVWRGLILYNDSYKDFCKLISGGFIDRVNPVENITTAFERYKSGREFLYKIREKIKPFHNFWPEYNND